MRRASAAFFALFVGFLIYQQLSPRASHAGGLAYASNFEEAQRAARNARKPILLNFGGPW